MREEREWEHWKSAWEAEQRPMPNVLKRARSDRQRAVMGLLGFIAITVVSFVYAMQGILHAGGAFAIAYAILTFAAVVGLAVGVFAAMRGTWAQSGGSPLQLLEALEGRHEGRRRLMLVVLVCMAVLVFGSAALDLLEYSRGLVMVDAVLRRFASHALAVGFVVYVTKRVKRTIDRELREAKEARRLLEA